MIRLEIPIWRSAAAGMDKVKQARLVYRAVPIAKIQKRFSGRVVLKPEIDLGLHRSAAVIDWIDVRFQTGRATQRRYIQEAAGDLLGRRPFVEQLDAMVSPHSGCSFRLRLQDISPREILTVLKALHQKFDIPSEPRKADISGIELSVDFYQKTPSDDERARLVGVLRRAIFPRPAQKLSALETPRTKGTGQIHRLTPLADRRLASELIYSPEQHQGGAVDHTFYIGRKHGPWMIRIQEKLTDQRSGTSRRELDEGDQRARVEVTLSANELTAMGIRTLDDLFAFSVTKLQAEYFAFFLPTFEERMGKDMTMSAAVRSWFLEKELERFKHAGILGLRWHRGVQAIRSKENAVMLKRLAKMLGKTPRRRSSVRASRNETDMAYAELNELVQSALKDLKDRMRRA